MTTNIPTQQEYEQHEAREFYLQIKSVEDAPLIDRQYGRSKWVYSLTHEPFTIGERVAWMLDGNYGYGAMKAAQSVAHNTRMNRAAWMGQTIAVLEWRCSARFAAAEWRKLDAEQRREVNEAIEAAIKGWLEEEAENA